MDVEGIGGEIKKSKAKKATYAKWGGLHDQGREVSKRKFIGRQGWGLS